jgi:endonuclease/exonuclease/phosphatase family metal-dependent hydrolase
VNKRIALAAILLLVVAGACAGIYYWGRPPAAQGQELAIGAWNIRDFSARSRDANELLLIAQVAHRMDCLAVIELNDGIVLGKLVQALETIGGRWAAVQSGKTGNTPQSAERYGFVYRSDRLRLRSPPRLLPELACPLAKGTQRFDREPCVASFATLDGRLDFTLIVVHVTWGASVQERRAEVRALRDYFLHVQDADADDDDVILLGDLNVDAGDPALDALLAIPTLMDVPGGGVPTVIRGSHTYDHILFERRHLKEYAGRHGVERFDESLFGGDDVSAGRACSDHRPVWLILRVPERDDD